MRPCGKLLAAAVLVAAALCGHSATASSDTSSVRFQDGKLWMNVHEAPPAELLKAVAQKTGVRFVVDSEIKPGPITLALDGMPLERAIRNLVASMPQAAGHTMTYSPTKRGAPRLVKVTLFGPGKSAVGTGATVYAEDAEPSNPVDAAPETLPTPNLDDRRSQMIAAGVPPETAEKVIGLTREVQKLQTTPPPGTYQAADLTAESREKLQALVDRGVPMERAVQMLLLQERYQDTLKDLQKVPGGMAALPTPPPGE